MPKTVMATKNLPNWSGEFDHGNFIVGTSGPKHSCFVDEMWYLWDMNLCNLKFKISKLVRVVGVLILKERDGFNLHHDKILNV